MPYHPIITPPVSPSPTFTLPVLSSDGVLPLQADNVGSNQMAKIRFALRGSATVLMGKNTMIRKIISLYIKDNPGHPLELVRGLFLFFFFLLVCPTNPPRARSPRAVWFFVGGRAANLQVRSADDERLV